MISRERTVPALLILILIAVLFAVSGCETLGLETPANPEEKIAAGFSTATAVNQGVSSLLRERKISSADAEQITDSTRSFAQGLRVARAMLGTDPSSADAKAESIRVGLEALRQYLISKGGKL